MWLPMHINLASINFKVNVLPRYRSFYLINNHSSIKMLHNAALVGFKPLYAGAFLPVKG